MYPLNLPEYNPRVKNEGKREIFCLIRKKFMVLTPEEWVRQHFLNLLINHLSYNRAMIRLEYSIKYFKSTKRSDIIVLNQKGDIFLVVECKSHKIELSQKAVSQLSGYNKVLKSKYIAISNGLKHFIWGTDGDKYVTLTAFPVYPKLVT